MNYSELDQKIYQWDERRTELSEMIMAMEAEGLYEDTRPLFDARDKIDSLIDELYAQKRQLAYEDNPPITIRLRDNLTPPVASGTPWTRAEAIEWAAKIIEQSGFRNALMLYRGVINEEITEYAAEINATGLLQMLGVERLGQWQGDAKSALARVQYMAGEDVDH